MHVHIIGICGTFMGGLAILAKELGYEVTGSDQNVYPPMSTQLEAHGIELRSGYRPENLIPAPDCVIVGNTTKRGNPEIESLLDQHMDYLSGPEWLARVVLKNRWVLAVAGTHGKTTTSSMLAWILEHAGHSPGFLIGGVPLNFGVSARLGSGRYFVVEADEYDTAFFDKRSKFVHYRPRTVILNNLEFDHADVFPDLTAIQRQFHHLVRTIPGNGAIVAPAEDQALKEVLQLGCWTPIERTAAAEAGAPAAWRHRLLAADGSRFEVLREGVCAGTVEWDLTGRHNVQNGIAAIAAAAHAGVTPEQAIAALRRFRNVRRRMELFAKIANISLYDDFAHHPTAIATTLEGLRAHVEKSRIIAVLEFRSNTMKMGTHAELLGDSLKAADLALVYQSPELGWNPKEILAGYRNVVVIESLDEIVRHLEQQCRPGDHVVFMSNGGFGAIHEKTAAALRATLPDRE